MDWIIDIDAIPLASWLKAMPEAQMLSRDQLTKIPAEVSAMLWCRLRSGEDVDLVLAPVIAAAQGRPVVLLADEPDERLVMNALAAGAGGCCNTHAAPEVLVQVALVVGNGGYWVGQSLLKHLVSTTTRLLDPRTAGKPRADWSAQLSERETQVARLVAGGGSNKEIALQLAITERTVKAHLTAIFEKLDLRDRLQLSLRINGLNL